MLANPNCLAFYPPICSTRSFFLYYAFKLHFVIHPSWVDWAYFMLRRLGVTAIASFGGAAIYQHSGAVLSFLNLYNLVPAVRPHALDGMGVPALLEGRGRGPCSCSARSWASKGRAGAVFMQCELWLLRD